MSDLKKVYILRDKTTDELYVRQNEGETIFFDLWSTADKWIRDNKLDHQFKVAIVYQIQN